MKNQLPQGDSQHSMSKQPATQNVKVATGGALNKIADLVGKAGMQLHSNQSQCDPPIQKDEKPASVSPEKSEEPADDEIFQSAMDGVHRSLWRHSPHPASPPLSPAPTNPDLEDLRLMHAAIEGSFPESISDHPEYIEGWIGVAGKRFLPNLRNGRYSIQGQIDLHGFNQAEAQAAVEDFIVQMSRFNSCCIKIIHGRGINSPTDRAALKEGLQRFLSTRRMSRYVVAYASAASCDGGVGAVYVLLSSQK
jgi:DNA-nicking Smr family endonuclease